MGLRQEREVAILFARNAIGSRVVASLAVGVALPATEGGVTEESVWALVIAPGSIQVPELAGCFCLTRGASLSI